MRLDGVDAASVVELPPAVAPPVELVAPPAGDPPKDGAPPRAPGLPACPLAMGAAAEPPPPSFEPPPVPDSALPAAPVVWPPQEIVANANDAATRGHHEYQPNPSDCDTLHTVA